MSCTSCSTRWLGLVSGSGKRSALEDVLVDALEPGRQRPEQVVRKALEEQPSHELDVPARCAGDPVPAEIGQRDLGRAAIGRIRTAFDQVALFQAPGMVREPAPLPPG